MLIFFNKIIIAASYAPTKQVFLLMQDAIYIFPQPIWHKTPLTTVKFSEG